MGEWLRGTWVGKGILGWILFIVVPAMFFLLRIFGSMEFIRGKSGDTAVIALIESPYFIIVLIALGLLLVIHTGLKMQKSSVKQIVRGNQSGQQISSIEISPMIPANQAAQSWLEWLHVQVAPSPGALPEILVVWSNLDNCVYDMRWQSDHGPVEETTARAERPSILPVILRSQRDETIMGTPVRGGVYYLTEINFQIHYIAAVQVSAGVHQLFIMIRNRNNQDAMREFKLTVPPTFNEPIRLETV